MPTGIDYTPIRKVCQEVNVKIPTGIALWYRIGASWKHSANGSWRSWTKRDETLARLAALESQERIADALDVSAEAVESLVAELRSGLTGDVASMRDTLQRLVSSVVLKKEGGTLLLRVPLPACAVVFDSTPGGMRTIPPHIHRIPY